MLQESQRCRRPTIWAACGVFVMLAPVTRYTQAFIPASENFRHSVATGPDVRARNMGKQTTRISTIACAILVSVSACNKSPPVDEAPVLQPGYWQARITLPGGDHRFLAGHVRGNSFKLSAFDGAHAFIFSGKSAKQAIRIAANQVRISESDWRRQCHHSML